MKKDRKKIFRTFELNNIFNQIPLDLFQKLFSLLRWIKWNINFLLKTKGLKTPIY